MTKKKKRKKKNFILILICHKENGTHELIYKKRNYYILKRQFCYKRKRSQEKGLLKQGLVCVDKQELVCVYKQGLVCKQDLVIGSKKWNVQKEKCNNKIKYT